MNESLLICFIFLIIYCIFTPKECLLWYHTNAFQKEKRSKSVKCLWSPRDLNLWLLELKSKTLTVRRDAQCIDNRVKKTKWFTFRSTHVWTLFLYHIFVVGFLYPYNTIKPNVVSLLTFEHTIKRKLIIIFQELMGILDGPNKLVFSKLVILSL